MKTRMMTVLCAALVVMSIGISGTWAAKPKAKQPVPVEVALTPAGEQLMAGYTQQLQALKAQIEKALPRLSAQQQAALLKVYQAEAEASRENLKTLRAAAKAKDKAAATKAHDAAKQALEQAQAAAQAPAAAMLGQLQPFLTSDKLDAALIKCVILTQATPRGLAAFAQEGQQQQALVDQLLSDDNLMRQMLIAGGAREGRYGQAMRIYTDILKASPKAAGGNLRRMAVATALEHAAAITQSNPTDQTDAPKTVDPVKRYLAYEKAFEAGELDPAFKDLTTWDYRMVINGDEPEETLAWGRQMLHNYRPDEISTNDYRWRYVKAVKTEVKYGSQDVKNDLTSLQPYQNMIMNGGVCGRRAFFGRFILRSFGIPVVRRPQQGHAALAHWTPTGWVVCLGAGWEWGWTDLGEGVDFAAYTQARTDESQFLTALRAQWVGSVLGETPAFGLHDKQTSGFWNAASLYQQRAIVQAAQAETLAAVGTDIGEANESKEKDVAETVALTPADKQITVASDGTIVIPAVACTSPTSSTEKIIFMQSKLGGAQLHYARLGKPETVEYTFNAPAAGKYALTARVVTTSDKQQLRITPNGGEATTVDLPFTVGMWDTTKPVEITLASGKNVLQLTRADPMKGVSIKDFTLTPVK